MGGPWHGLLIILLWFVPLSGEGAPEQDLTTVRQQGCNNNTYSEDFSKGGLHAG